MPVKIYKVHGREGFVAMASAEEGGRERVVGGVERHGDSWGVFVPADTQEPLDSGFTSATAAKAYMAGLFKGVELAARGTLTWGQGGVVNPGVPGAAAGISGTPGNMAIQESAQGESGDASEDATHRPKSTDDPTQSRPEAAARSE